MSDPTFAADRIGGERPTLSACRIPGDPSTVRRWENERPRTERTVADVSGEQSLRGLLVSDLLTIFR